MLHIRKGRKRWREQIVGGRVLHEYEIAEMGAKGLSEYLRAMDVSVGREVQSDTDEMRRKLKDALANMHVSSWSVANKAARL